MKIISLIKKYQLIIFLFFLIILLSWLKIRYGSKENNNGNEEITKEEIIIKTTPTVLAGKADILSNETKNKISDYIINFLAFLGVIFLIIIFLYIYDILTTICPHCKSTDIKIFIHYCNYCFRSF